MGHTLRYEKDMKRIFSLNLKFELKNFVVVNAKIRQYRSYYSPNGIMVEQSMQLINTANLTGNSIKWTFPQTISIITFARVKNIFVNPNLGKEGLYSKEEMFELNSYNYNLTYFIKWPFVNGHGHP